MDGRDDLQRRLLDLLAGWMEYVRLCSEGIGKEPNASPDMEEYRREFEFINKLYQLVAARRRDGFDGHFVKWILRDNVIPFLLMGPGKELVCCHCCKLIEGNTLGPMVLIPVRCYDCRHEKSTFAHGIFVQLGEPK